MQAGSNKGVVSRYFLQGLGELNPDIIDEVFAPDHVLSSPEFGPDAVPGTQVIKDAIEGFRRDADGISCTIHRRTSRSRGHHAQPRSRRQDRREPRRGEVCLGAGSSSEVGQNRYGQEGYQLRNDRGFGTFLIRRTL
jgi:hypothetical protein